MAATVLIPEATCQQSATILQVYIWQTPTWAYSKAVTGSNDTTGQRTADQMRNSGRGSVLQIKVVLKKGTGSFYQLLTWSMTGWYSVLASQGCCDKVPHTEGTRSLTVVENEVSKQGIGRVPFFWGPWGRCPGPLFSPCRWPSPCLFTLSSFYASSSSHGLLPVYVSASTFSVFVKTQLIYYGPR